NVAEKPAVAVAAAPVPAALPDIPDATVKCLQARPPRTKTADETVRALQAMDAARRKCAATHLAWYRERQAAAAAPAAPVASEPVKKKPAATWE
ncbi:MAG: hypothetical protein RLZ98_3456, partial [Pseudomonadota bacterium]